MLDVHGGVPLSGTVRVRGAKNLVPKAMVAALLGDTPSVRRGVPAISDVEIVTGLLGLHGVRVTPGPDGDDPDGELVLDPADVEQGSIVDIDAHARSEERRVGKECRARGGAETGRKDK